MLFNYKYTNSFKKDLKAIAKGNPKMIKRIESIVEIIKKNPQDDSLHYEKIKGCKGLKLRYLVGMKYRILVEIEIKNNLIIFKRVGQRENFY